VLFVGFCGSPLNELVDYSSVQKLAALFRGSHEEVEAADPAMVQVMDFGVG
jgi:hypothetical protein